MTTVGSLGAGAFGGLPTPVPVAAPAPEVPVGGGYEVPELLRSRPRGQGQERTTQEIVSALSREKTQKTVEKLNNVLVELGDRLAFDLFQGTDEFYAKIVDRRTNKVVKVMPPEEVLEFHAKMKEFVGRLIDQKA